MSNLTHIYENQNGKILLLDILNYTLEEFKNNPYGCYPNWNPSSMIASEIKYEHPTISSEDEGLREKTREERIAEGETELLQDGEYVTDGKIVTVPCPEGLLKKEWDKELHIWKESATEEEQKTEWFNRINTWKPKVLEGPFRYLHSDGKTYRQKLRVGKDDTLLSTAIQALIRNADIPAIEWAFDDENNSVLMTLEDLRKLQDTGFVWTQCVYEAERELKAMEADFTKNINFFKETAIKHLDKYKITVFKTRQ